MAGGVPAGRLSIELVAEIARLQQDLDKAKKLVNSASNDIAKSARAANDNLAEMAGGIGRAGNQSKLASHHMANLSFQIQDIIIGLQGGQKPMTVFLQQGSQIGQIAMQAGVGLGAMARATLAMAAAATTALLTNPYFLAAASAASLFAAGVALVTEEINKNSAVTVTWQDVLLGAFDVVKEAISSRVTSAFEAMGLDIGEVWEDVKRYTKTAINFIIGASTVVPRTIAATYDKIGPAIGDAFYSAANLAIDALNWLAQKSLAPLNLIIDAINLAFDKKIPRVVVDGIDNIKNPYEGALGRLGAAGAKALGDTFQRDFIGEIGGALKDAAVARALRRDAEDTGEKVGKAAGAKSGKAAGDEFLETFIEKVNKDLSRSMAKIFKDAEKITAGIFKASDDELENVLKGIQERRRFEEWKRQEEQRIAQENRDRALNTAYEIADIIGGAFGDVVAELANAVIPLVDVSSKLGALLESFGKGAILGGAIGGVTGSRSGGAIGGGLGQVLGEEFLTKGLASISNSLGKFAGPIGAIAGGLLGGIIGGMLKSTPRASATVSIIAGEAMDTAIKGSSGKLRKIAGGMADSVVSGLLDIADQFGAELMGDAQVSIGMRKKNYRVDPTGRGITKTSKGAIDFGDDQAAAIAYAIQVAIQQGVIGGLSESLKRLIQGDGDLQSQLQKALSFQSVFDELFQRLDPQGFDLAQLDKWRASMDKIFAEAGATAEELAKLEELTGLKRAEIVEKYAKEIAQAEDDARQIRQLEIEIMRLSGDTLGALAAERALEQEGMSAAVIELMKRRDALVDEAEAAQEAARAAEELAARERAIADERYRLESRLIPLLGDTAEATALMAAQLGRERDALDESNLALFDRIKALEAEAVVAAAAARAAEELAARNKAIANEISGLDRQWLQLTGDVEKLRELQLGDLLSDDARTIQRMIWAEEDRQAAEEAARRAAEEAARAAEQAAQAYARAIEEHNQAIESARNTLAQAYERESSALRQTIETFRAFGQEIRAFRQNLFVTDNRALGYDQARAQFLNTSRMAGLGNEASLQRFTGDAQAFLDLARGRAGSLADYQREAALVAREALKAERSAGGMVTEAQRQLRLMDQQVKGILDLNEKAISFGEALDAYHALQARQMPTFVNTVSNGIETVADRIEQADARQENRDTEAAKRDVDAARREETMLIALNRIERLLSRLETDDGLAVSLRGPLPVTGSVDARITNPTGSPVPTKEVV